MTDTTDVMNFVIDTDDVDGSFVITLWEDDIPVVVLGDYAESLRETWRESGVSEIMMMALERKGPMSGGTRDWVYDHARGWEPDTVYRFEITDDEFTVKMDGDPVDIDEWADKYAAEY